MNGGGGDRQRVVAEAQRLAKGGDFAGAAEVLRSALARCGEDAPLRYQYAEVLAAAGRADEAIDALIAGMERCGDAPQPLRLLGSLLFSRGRFQESLEVFRRLATVRAKSPEAHEGVAKSLIELGRAAEGVEYLRGLGDGASLAPVLRRTLGEALFRAGDLRGAMDVLTPLAEQENSGGVWALLARVHERARDADSARAAAERALSLSPGDEAAARVLARLDRAEGRLREAQRRLELVERGPLAPEARGHVCMELGQVLDELGAFDRAWAMFEDGHGAFAAANPRLKEQFEAFLRRLRHAASWEPKNTGAWGDGFEDGVNDPVFLVGAPRSGTTLFEQILGGLPGVRTSDEAPMLVETINRCLSARRCPADALWGALSELTDAEARALRSFYWERTAHHVGRIDGGGLLVDKHPLNTGYLAVVRRLFPRARVVCVVRDPRDVVLSMYMQDLVPGGGMLHYATLSDAARAYAALMGAYLLDRGRLGLTVHETRYEDLLAEPERTARALVSALSRPWRDDLLAFAERARQRASGVNPYSTSKDLYTSSASRWKRYAEEIRRVETMLRRFIETFGYGASGP